MHDKDFVTVSVIIPAYNEQSYIERCLTSLKRLDRQGFGLEVVVVDNGSTDGTRQIAEHLGARVLIKEYGSISALRNFGAGMSNGDVLAFLDADCEVPPNWLTGAAAYIQSPQPTVLAFRMVIPENSNWVSNCWDLLFTKRNTTGQVDWVPTGNMFMSRKLFSMVGGFDERLESNEDYDFCFRARGCGCRIISSSEASVIHWRPPVSLKGVVRKEIWHGREVLRVFLSDVLSDSWMNPLRARNAKVIGYSALFLLAPLAALTLLPLAFMLDMYMPIVPALMSPLCVSCALALIYTVKAKRLRLFPGMILLLTAYGCARAAGLLLHFAPRARVDRRRALQQTS